MILYFVDFPFFPREDSAATIWSSSRKVALGMKYDLSEDGLHINKAALTIVGCT